MTPMMMNMASTQARRYFAKMTDTRETQGRNKPQEAMKLDPVALTQMMHAGPFGAFAPAMQFAQAIQTLEMERYQRLLKCSSAKEAMSIHSDIGVRTMQAWTTAWRSSYGPVTNCN